MKAKHLKRLCVSLLGLLGAVIILLAMFAMPGVLPAAYAAETLAGAVEVTGFEITDPNGYYTGSITKGMSVNFILTIHDTRVLTDTVSDPTNPSSTSIALLDEVDTSSIPRVTLNTASFTTDPGRIYVQNGSIREDAGGITYKLIFDQIYYTGIGNTLEFDLFYSSNHSIPLFTKSITVNQCEEYVEPPPSSSDSSSAAVIGTGFVLKSVNFGGSEVNAGASFDLDLELMATSGTYSVNNVAVAVTPSKEFTIAAGASNIYIGTVSPGSTFAVKVPLTASATVEAGSYNVSLTVSGVSANDGTSVSATVTVTIPLIQPERFEISNVMAPDYLTAGMDDGMGYGSVSLVNKGKGIIYNVSVDVVGDGVSTSEGNQFIGNITAGSESVADFNVLAATPGQVDAQIVVTYENDKGEEKQLTHDFVIDVQDGGMGGDMPMDPFPMPEPMPELPAGAPLWLGVCAAAIVVAGGVTCLVLLVRRSRKKKAALLDDDFDEEEDRESGAPVSAPASTPDEPGNPTGGDIGQ